MAKTLANLRTTTRMYLDEVSEADWTDDQINTQLNFRYLGVYSAVLEVFEDYYRKVVTSGTIANQGEYALPSDFFKMQRLEVKYNASEEYRKVTYFDTQQMAQQIGTDYYGATHRPIYSLSGDYIQLLPVPETSISSALRMYYIRELPELSADSDEIEIPFANRYANYISLAAAGDLLRKGQQEETAAARYIAEYELSLDQMKSQLENRHDGVKSILDTEGEIIQFDYQHTPTYTYN